MNRRGIEYSLMEVEPGLWKWCFQIGGDIKTGKTQTNLMGLAVHRAQQRIDRELKKAGDLVKSPK